MKISNELPRRKLTVWKRIRFVSKKLMQNLSNSIAHRTNFNILRLLVFILLNSSPINIKMLC